MIKRVLLIARKQLVTACSEKPFLVYRRDEQPFMRGKLLVAKENLFHHLKSHLSHSSYATVRRVWFRPLDWNG